MKSEQIYRTKKRKLSGTTYSEIHEKAFRIYKKIKSRTKRRPYIRSAYFIQEKVFLTLFWSHLEGKFDFKDKVRRLKYYPCALDLIINSHFKPVSKVNVDREAEILHRFQGMTPESEVFVVQIKENKRNGQKYLISIFPLKK